MKRNLGTPQTPPGAAPWTRFQTTSQSPAMGLRPLDPRISPTAEGERLYYVAPAHPRARALGWRLYVRESELVRLQRKYR